MNIVAEIGLPAVLEQTAEEAAELSKACLKLARVIRGENPTPVTYDEALKDVKEESTDVSVCLSVLDWYSDVHVHGSDYIKTYNQKTKRWMERIAEMKKEREEKGE